MELAALCAVVAALRVVPNRSQFFQYESMSLLCEPPGNSSRWGVKRNTSTHTNQECVAAFASCLIPDLYPLDSGVYWCESAAGERSSSVSITVTAGAVILESPAHPVMEGEAATLRCSGSRTSSSRLDTYFYRDGLLVGNSSTGNLTLRSVSKSDEGRYKCSFSGAESPGSWLEVTEAGRPELSEFTLALILLPVVVKSLVLFSLVLCCLWRKSKNEPQRKQIRSLYCVGPRTCVRSTYTSGPVLTCKACS